MTDSSGGSSTPGSQQLGALADVVRMLIVDALHYRGPLTTGQLTKITKTRSLSGHLKILADAGIVQQVGDDARLKTIWQLPARDEHAPLLAWEPATEGDDQSQAQAVRALNQASTYRRIQRMREFDDQVQRDEWGDIWADVAVGRDYVLRLSAAQLETLEEKLAAVLSEAKELSSTNQSSDAEETEPVFITLAGFPIRWGDQE